MHAPTQEAFGRLRGAIDLQQQPLLLDSGCGTGDSTLQLASLFPGHLVIGVDQSAARLQRYAPQGLALIGNALLLRAELTSFWRLLVDASLCAEGHWLLYPNPWPKAAHLGRRWHAHPVFPTLMQTSAQFELRSNWRVYVDEFAQALRHAGHASASTEPLEDAPALTPFERKYRISGHPLWRVQTACRGAASAAIACDTERVHRG